jgi:hypothetical protein
MSLNDQKLINLRLLFSVKCKTIHTYIETSRNDVPENNNENWSFCKEIKISLE